MDTWKPLTAAQEHLCVLQTAELNWQEAGHLNDLCELFDASQVSDEPGAGLAEQLAHARAEALPGRHPGGFSMGLFAREKSQELY